MVDAFAAGETIRFELDGTQVELSGGDVLTEPTQKPGFMAQQDRGVTVVLDTNLTQDLIDEGYAREIISKVQDHAQGSGLRRHRPHPGALPVRRQAGLCAGNGAGI